MDLILNGQAQGSVATTLLNNNFDFNCLRPWVGADRRHYIAQNIGGKQKSVPAMVANATLRKDEWKILDDAVIMAARERLRVVADLRSAGLTYSVPNGMSKTILESENVGRITPATISMDPARKSEGDRPEYELVGVPLPVVHKDFYFNARQIAASRNTGGGIDTTTAEEAAIRVSEEIEKLTLGVSSSFEYGGYNIYGLTNFPSRITRTISDPVTSGWTPEIAVQDILAMRQDSVDKFHRGPWRMYNSPAWDEYLDDDYKANSDITLRTRILQIAGIQSIDTADFLTGRQLVLVQQSRSVIRMVMGMDVTTLQWETDGGMRINFKVMAIMVPQLRADFNGNTGIVHGNV